MTGKELVDKWRTERGSMGDLAASVENALMDAEMSTVRRLPGRVIVWQGERGSWYAWGGPDRRLWEFTWSGWVLVGDESTEMVQWRTNNGPWGLIEWLTDEAGREAEDV